MAVFEPEGLSGTIGAIGGEFGLVTRSVERCVPTQSVGTRRNDAYLVDNPLYDVIVAVAPTSWGAVKESLK
ncbi:MAG: hypothetical protein V1800_01680 [Candidatus Latescibacterota bacterium]